MIAKPLALHEPAPWFICRTETRERFAVDTVAGRYIVICFFESAADPVSASVLKQIASDRNRFDDGNISFFGVSVDPDDERHKRVSGSLPGIRYIWDFDREVSKRYGAQQTDGTYQKVTYVLDPSLRVLAVLPFPPLGDSQVFALGAVLDQLPRIGPEYRASVQAPVLVVPRIFEPKLCSALIDYYTANGGEDSGFMQEVNGMTVAAIKHDHPTWGRRGFFLLIAARSNARHQGPALYVPSVSVRRGGATNTGGELPFPGLRKQ